MDVLLERVKHNLILTHGEDDGLLKGYITAATAYAESYQHITEGYYKDHPMPPTTEQAVIMLSSHFYESRMVAQVVSSKITLKQHSRFGTLSICFFGLTEIGRCEYEFWQNEHLH